MLFPYGLCLVTTAVTALRERFQLALYQLFAQWRYAVDEHLPLQMVELMLHAAGLVAFYPLVVGLKVFVYSLHADACGARHLLVDGRQRQATLFRR